MGKRAQTAISFDKKFLNKLKEDPNSCVHIQKDVKRLPIHPFRLIDINACIKDIFQTKIAKYDEKLNGILLGYQNTTLIDNDRETFDGSFTHLDIQADFYVFRPVIGSILNGIVNKKSKDHVGCLVYNTFNVSLLRPQGEESWFGQNINIGSEVQFKINFTNMDSRLPDIKGELLSIVNDSGFSANDSFVELNNKIKFNDSDEDEHEDESGEKLIKKHKKTKKKEKVIEEELEEDEDYQEIKVKKSKKHKKKRKEEYEETGIIKKSKRKKEKHKNETMSQSYEENDEIPDQDIEIKKLKRRKRKHEESTMLSQDFDQDVSNKSKKHKKNKLKSELINEDLNQLEGNEDMEMVKKKKKKSKNKDEFLESLMHSIDDEFDHKIKKHKKHKRKKVTENDQNDEIDYNVKHKKKKREKND